MKKNNRRIAEATASLLLCMAILLTGVRAENLQGARKVIRTAAAPASKHVSLPTEELSEERIPLASPEEVFGQNAASSAPVVMIPETAVPATASITTQDDTDDDDSTAASAPKASSRTSKPSSYWGETTPSRKSSGNSSNTTGTGDLSGNDDNANDGNNEDSKPVPPVAKPDGNDDNKPGDNDNKEDDKNDEKDPTIGDTGSENDPGTDDNDPSTGDNDKDPDTGDKDPGADLTSTVAIKWLGNTNDLLGEFYALDSAKEKQELLGIKDNNFSNDSFRRKLHRENGDSWEKLESEIVAATQYQQGRTMYVQPYLINRKGSQFDVVIYANTSTDAIGQWTTNLIYDSDSEIWYEYVKKHPYNNSREAYKLNYANNMSWSELRDEILSDENWVAIDGSAAQPAVLSMSRSIVALNATPIDQEEITIGASEEAGEMEETIDEVEEETESETEEEEDEDSEDEDEAHKIGSIVAIPEEETGSPVIEKEEATELEDEQTEEEEATDEPEETSSEEDAPSDETEE